MAWRRPGDKPLSEPMMVSLLMHICVTRPQWVNKSDPSCNWYMELWARVLHWSVCVYSSLVSWISCLTGCHRGQCWLHCLGDVICDCQLYLLRGLWVIDMRACLLFDSLMAGEAYIRADSRFAPSQWETELLCNDISHCLGASLESALIYAWTGHHWLK